jgi:hypothetical protein
MMDSFDEKRGMVKKLLDMLKSHASNEVNTGMKKPEGEGDMHGVEVEKVQVIPDHEMDTATPEHDIDTHEMNEGGVVEKVNGQAPGEIPYESDEGHPDKPGAAHGESEDDMQPSSMFESFLGKKKRK